LDLQFIDTHVEDVTQSACEVVVVVVVVVMMMVVVCVGG
jgi:hypothetical protein